MVDLDSIIDASLRFVMCRHFNDPRIVIVVCVDDGSYRSFRFGGRINLRHLLVRDGTFHSWEEIADNMMVPEGGWLIPQDKLGHHEVIRSMAAAMVEEEF